MSNVCETSHSEISHSLRSCRNDNKMKLKICGMKYNTPEVAILQPDYLGFIFYDKSPRNFQGNISEIDASIKKVGVFVDEDIEKVINHIKTYQLNAVQLHGEESPEYCQKLKELCHYLLDTEYDNKIPAKVYLERSRKAGMTEIIKVFSIKNEFDFNILKPYEGIVDYFLFDTKGELPGGNGYTFDWSVLNDYPSTTPYFLSGGIGIDEIEKLKTFKESSASKFCYALDVNSKFEIEPGLKNISELEKFKKEICHVERM